MIFFFNFYEGRRVLRLNRVEVLRLFLVQDGNRVARRGFMGSRDAIIVIGVEVALLKGEQGMSQGLQLLGLRLLETLKLRDEVFAEQVIFLLFLKSPGFALVLGF